MILIEGCHRRHKAASAFANEYPGDIEKKICFGDGNIRVKGDTLHLPWYTGSFLADWLADSKR